MVEFKTLLQKTLQLDYGRFIEVAVKQGDKAAFLRIAGGELYLDGEQSMSKRYNKGWVSIPINKPEYSKQIADFIQEIVADYYDGSDESMRAERDKVDLITKAVESPLKAQKTETKGKGKGK